MVDFVDYAGKSNVGAKQKANEDFILCDAESFGDDGMLALIADGAGSKDDMFRPATVACTQVQKMLQRFYNKNPEMFFKNIRMFLEQAMYTANDVLIAFKLGDEQSRYEYATTLTCAFLERNGRLTVGHCGNTRLYVIRNTKTTQVTKDHTDGQLLVDAGTITEEAYYTAIERLRLNNGIGMYAEPEFQMTQLKLRKNDVVVMTTDGIHYSYRPNAFFDILMDAPTMDDAADKMIQTALDLNNYPDNLSCIVMWLFTDPNAESGKKEEEEEK